MKLFATHITPKKIVLIAQIVCTTPFVYAAYQSISSQVNTSTPVNMIPLVESEVDYRFATSSYAEIPDFAPEEIFVPIEKVRKGTVQSVDKEHKSFILKVGDNLISVQDTASTTFYLGGGDVTDESSVTSNMKIYVFGHMNMNGTLLSAQKIVIANKSKLLRQ